MRLAYSFCQPFICIRNQHKMDMVRHQTIRPDGHLISEATLFQQMQIMLIIRFFPKCLLHSVAHLDHMMRDPGDYNPRYSCHPDYYIEFVTNDQQLGGVPYPQFTKTLKPTLINRWIRNAGQKEFPL